MEELAYKVLNCIDKTEKWALSEQQSPLTLIELLPPGLCQALVVCNQLIFCNWALKGSVFLIIFKIGALADPFCLFLKS